MRGYKEEGTTSTPFDMCVMNDLDRFHLVNDMIDSVPKLGARVAYDKRWPSALRVGVRSSVSLCSDIRSGKVGQRQEEGRGPDGSCK